MRYIETRSETMLEMQHGRAQVQDVEIGGTRDGKVTGLKVRVIADAGAYPADAALMPMLTGLMSSGVYEIPKIDFHFDCVVTNTTPIGAYRGAGRPEATALVERAIDMFAAEIGMDPAEVRRKNFITDFPHQTVMGANYDSGEYHAALDKCLANAGYDGLRADQAARRESGDVKQLGLGLCSYVEWTGFGSELGTCTVEEDGTVTVTAGTSSHGQGHETSYAQLVAGTLGIPMKDIKVIQSDTKLVKRGMGTMGSRSLQVGGTAVQNATDEVLDKAKRLAAHLLEADAGDIQVVRGEGLAVAGSPGSAIPWADLARAAADPARRPEGFEGGLSSENDFETPDATYPFGTHLAVVEVDTETGLVDLVRHITVDDAGRIANPMLVEGQVHGGIAQGVAQALFEEIAFDEDGNNVTGNLASLRDPVRGRPAELRDRAHADADAAQPAGGEGHRRGGRDRRHAGGLERRDRRARAPGRAQHRHARDASARLEGASARRAACPRPEPSSRSRGWPGPRRAARGRGRPCSSACSRRASASDTPSRWVSSGCAQKQPWRTPMANSSLSRLREHVVVVAGEVERGDADPVVVGRPQLVGGDAVDRRQPGVQAGGERELARLGLAPCPARRRPRRARRRRRRSAIRPRSARGRRPRSRRRR